MRINQIKRKNQSKRENKSQKNVKKIEINEGNDTILKKNKHRTHWHKTRIFGKPV